MKDFYVSEKLKRIIRTGNAQCAISSIKFYMEKGNLDKDSVVYFLNQTHDYFTFNNRKCYLHGEEASYEKEISTLLNKNSFDFTWDYSEGLYGELWDFFKTNLTDNNLGIKNSNDELTSHVILSFILEAVSSI